MHQTIYLDQSRVARAFPIEETLWTPELKRMLLMLANHRESVKSLPVPAAGSPRSAEERAMEPYLAIAVFGPSGSGKSSLLRTLMRIVNSGDGDQVERVVDAAYQLEGLVPETRRDGSDRGGRNERDRIGDLSGRLHALSVLQPDKFQDSHQFLYAFLANALTEERRLREERHTRGWQDRYEPEALSPVQQSFQTLSEYLRVLDKTEIRDAEHDPLGVSLDHLESHTSGFLLHRHMANFIDTLATALTGEKEGQRGSLLLLPVDDADLAPQHLLPILRVFQSYLLHPRLVPVFTFTDRAAEEILRNDFEKYVGDRPRAGSAAGGGHQRLPIAQNLALQYLSRSFPVRNRIRLGPAPARVRGVVYGRRFLGTGSSDSNETLRAVRELLEQAGLLLFGQPDRQARHDLYAALRVSTLRRQLHVVDEMVAAGVERYLVDPPTDPPPRRWVQVFDRAAWALMNVHRDVLREYALHLEDLYSWSPTGLRRIVLGTLLNRSPLARRTILQRWRYRTDSRRGQILSLLAANVFRPWLPGEEPAEDEHYLPTPAQVRNAGDRWSEGDGRLLASTGMLWFTEVVLGFYLPQVLARDQPPPGPSGDSDAEVGIGWNLRYGAVSAIRAAQRHGKEGALGMTFLHVSDLEKGLKKYKNSDRLSLLLRSWCFVGFTDEGYWAAVSLWRGLTLMVRLLEARRELDLRGENPEETWEAVVRRVLVLHLALGMVPGSLLGEGGEPARLEYEFPDWTETVSHIGPEPEPLTGIVEELASWAKERSKHDDPLNLVELQVGQLTERRWSGSFIRRIHGAEVVGDFMPRLHAAYIEQRSDDRDKRWNADVALRAWSKVLVEYWRGIPQMQLLLRTCPLLTPFLEPLSESEDEAPLRHLLGPPGEARTKVETLLRKLATSESDDVTKMLKLLKRRSARSAASGDP